MYWPESRGGRAVFFDEARKEAQRGRGGSCIEGEGELATAGLERNKYRLVFPSSLLLVFVHGNSAMQFPTSPLPALLPRLLVL